MLLQDKFADVKLLHEDGDSFEIQKIPLNTRKIMIRDI